MEKPIVKALGGMYVGEHFLYQYPIFWRSSSAVGRFELYEDRIMFKEQVLPKFLLSLFKTSGEPEAKDILREITLSYDSITGYKERNTILFGRVIHFTHKDKQQPPYLQFLIFSGRKAKMIIDYIEQKGIVKNTN